MNRRNLCLAAWSPTLAFAQTKPLVALLTPLSARAVQGPNPSNQLVAAFLRGLADIGWRIDENLRFEPRGAEGRPELYGPLAAELLALRPDVLVAAGPTVEAVKSAAPTIPVVMAGVEDPIATGLVQTLARPGGLYTGVSNQSADLMGKRIELALELLGRPGLVAMMYDRAARGQWSAASAAAQQRRWQLLSLPVSSAADLEPALARAAAAKALAVIANGGLIIFEHRRINALAASLRLPVIYPQAAPVRAGAVMSYGADIQAVYYRAAHFTDRILRGERPALMSIEQPTRFELVLNMATARALQLKVSNALLLRADERIE